LASIRYSGHTKPEVMCAPLSAAPRGATGDTGAAAAHVTRALLSVLTALVAQTDGRAYCTGGLAVRAVPVQATSSLRIR
jgi:hypothetical protein